jgi:hypothetical protein
MDPDAVTGREIGHRGDGERGPGAFHADVYLWASEVKGRRVRMSERASRAKSSGNKEKGEVALGFQSHSRMSPAQHPIVILAKRLHSYSKGMVVLLSSL